MSTVNWAGLTADSGAEQAVADVNRIASGFDPLVPAVLIPVRVETRFATAEVAGGGVIQPLLDALQQVHVVLQRLQTRSYATTLSGTVKQKTAYKRSVEEPLYAATDADLSDLADAVQRTVARTTDPITTATPAQQTQLNTIIATLRGDEGKARTAVGQLRSVYQRQRLTGGLNNQLTALDTALQTVDQRVLGTLKLVSELKVRPAAVAARAAGRTPTGQPLRPGLIAAPPPAPTAAGVPAARVVIDDNTTAAALGAGRIVPVESAQLADTAATVAQLNQRLADPTAPLGADLQAAAAAITVLPGTTKAELLAGLDAAAGRPGAAEIRREIAATPSDRPDLDATVPPAAAGAVYTIQPAVTTVHRLLVRIYPEPIAVDTHEDELTVREQTDGANFWTQTTAAGTDQTLLLGAWRALCIGRTSRRAAWIARAMQPVATAAAAASGPTPGMEFGEQISAAITVLAKRLADLPSGRTIGRPALTARQSAAIEKAVTAVESAVGAATTLPAASITDSTTRLQTQAAAVRALALRFTGASDNWLPRLTRMITTIGQLPVEPAPVVRPAAVGTRSGTWTKAASSTVLPDRFAVLTVSGGTVSHLSAGAPIPDDLKISFAPTDDAFSLDAEGNLVLPDSIAWLADYDTAVAKGMAITVEITPTEAAAGFDELLVIGLADGDAADGAERLTAMLDAHHYTADGLALLAIGTPTNNTESGSAGYSSADDPDAAYPIERGSGLATAGTDGNRLAASLGIDSTVLDHVRGADNAGISHALSANHALYPGTIGHGLEELASGLISRDARERLRSYAIDHVVGRGVLPTIRVADQPYGFLPAIALGRYAIDLRDSGVAGQSATEAARQTRFENTLASLLTSLHQDWSAMRTGADGGPAVRYAHSPDIGRPGFDAQQHFLTMLGLQPSSVASGYRFAVNVADRGGVRGRPDLDLGFGVPRTATSGSQTAVAADVSFGPFATMEHLQTTLRQAIGTLAGTELRDPHTGGVTLPWQPVLDAIAGSRAYGLRLLTGLHPLRGRVVVPDATGTWLQRLLGLTATQLRDRAITPGLDNVGLAELFIRQALLAERRRVAAAILIARGVMTEAAVAALGTSSLYRTWSVGSLTQTSAWGMLFSSVNELGRLSSTVSVPAYLTNRTMADYLDGPTIQVVDQPLLAPIASHRTAVSTLAQLPPAELAAVTSEHLDICSYRLDAWLTGLANRRLTAMRASRPSGAQLGAYGWVEDLRPAAVATAASNVPAALAGRPGRPLIADPTGEGFIQTPSPSHAVTAAVLRAAYRSQQAEGSFGNEMSVNLSSSRVRTALGLIDGVRAGNDLGALLGYQLERFLHEYYARPDTQQVTELDSTIYPLRTAYPTVAQVDPSADAASEPTRHVVDGLALVRTVLDWLSANAPGATGTLYTTLTRRLGDYPWGIKAGALPAVSDTGKLLGVLAGIDAIADALDALGDLVTSETVHQIVRGNHTRAAAVLSALNEGTAIPRPEVTDTPRTGLPVTHRVLLQLPAVAADPLAPPAGWETVPMTPAACCEPSVNAWLAGLLGDPALIRVRLTSPSLPVGAAHPEVSLAALGLQPLDLVSLLAQGLESAVGVLTARVLDQLQPADLPPDQPGVVSSDGPQTSAVDGWQLDPVRAVEWKPEIRSITDVAPLLETAADLLGKCRPATEADYAAPEFTPAAGSGVDLTDLATRVGRLADGARAAVVALARLLAADPSLDATVLDSDPQTWLSGLATSARAAELPGGWLSKLDLNAAGQSAADLATAITRLDAFWADRQSWRSAVLDAAAYGVRAPLPRRFVSRSQVSSELLQAAESAFLQLATRCRTAAAGLAGAASPTPDSVWSQVAQDLLGEGVTMIPRVSIDTVRGDVGKALAAELADAGSVDSWLEGAAAVRPGAALLADLQVFAEALGRPGLTGRVAQLPSVPGEPWLAGPVPDPADLSGRVSVVIYGADKLPDAGASGPALMLDTWSEEIPYQQESTSVALHYDQPDATAPQSVLLAVPPTYGGGWTLADLAATLHDTLEIARNRTVELDQIAASRYGQLLPLLVGEVVPDIAAGSGDDRVILDFEQNNP